MLIELVEIFMHCGVQCYLAPSRTIDDEFASSASLKSHGFSRFHHILSNLLVKVKSIF